ncbi:MAG: penicillin-binding protein 1A [Flavobacteriaceae bacterium]
MSKKKKTNSYKKYLIWLWSLFFAAIVSVIILFKLVGAGVFGELPTFEELENPDTNFATEIISADGVTLGKFFKENRTPVTYNELPQNLVDALVSTEDVRYFEHSGIDFRGFARALAAMGADGGASTITQQLAKLLFHGEGSKNTVERVVQKLKEWVIAVELERQYTKEEIMAMYLNKVDFLYNAIGIRSASRIYFGKEPIDLSVQESATLVGMLKNPALYNPKRNTNTAKNAFKRKNVVLSQMEKYGKLSASVHDSLVQEPIKLDFSPEGHNDGIATYFRSYLQDYMKSWVKDHPKPDGKKYNLYSDGLKIYVTLDSRLQKYAEEAVHEHITNLQHAFQEDQKSNPTAPFYNLREGQIDTLMRRAMFQTQRYRGLKKAKKSDDEILENFKTPTEMTVYSYKGDLDTIMSPMDSIRYSKSLLHTGLVSMEPQTGHVKAWVGGIDHKYYKYDHVKQGARQVGSTFKPFVYAAAINQLKLSPCQEYPNTKYTIPAEDFGLEEDWTPKNSGDSYGGVRTLKNALANSINVVTARLMHMVGPRAVSKLAREAGITSRVPAYPSIGLGTLDVTLYDMVSAYSTFANRGLHVDPMFITRIEDKNGTVIEQFTPKTREVLSEESAYVVIELLKGVTEGGSGIRLRSQGGVYPYDASTGYPYQFDNPIAGKTGTTQNQSDGWFMGMVPNLATGVWTGADDRAAHFEGIALGQGASMSLPTWALYMKKVYADSTLTISREDFVRPDNLSIEIDCGKMISTDANGELMVEEDEEEF